MAVKITVVIPTFKRASAVRRCVEFLAEQGSDFDVIVVADASCDGTTEMLRSLKMPFPLPCLELPENSGLSAARNAGARAATGEWLLFLDDDMTATPNLIPHHIAKESPRTVVFGRTMEPRTNDPQRAYYARLDNDPTPQWPFDAWIGPNCSVARDLLLEAGGFDESEFARCCEDIDMGFRLWNLGVTFSYAQEAMAVHHDERSWCLKRRAEHAHGRAAIALRRKYPAYRRYLPLAGIVRSPWKRWFARGWFAGVLKECGGWDTLRAFAGMRLPVLLYHHVGEPSPETTRDSLTVTPKNFALQMRWLHDHNYTAIAPPQWRAWVNEGTPLPDKPVLLTFDDGFADLSDYAFPLMQQLGMRGAVFPISSLNPKNGG